MVAVPVVGILAADARQIRAVAFGAPLERMIVLTLGGERVMTVALDLVAQRADHLRVAKITTLADVNVAAGQFERRIRSMPGAVSIVLFR